VYSCFVQIDLDEKLDWGQQAELIPPLRPDDAPNREVTLAEQARRGEGLVEVEMNLGIDSVN
jgi:hypothetical protein